MTEEYIEGPDYQEPLPYNPEGERSVRRWRIQSAAARLTMDYLRRAKDGTLNTARKSGELEEILSGKKEV